ncbi:MAG TPA: hypothetical protein VNJ52_00380 [Patescibacteria group bacterium]|nr:hypothetical protein [Patescibacteria group bacterium]
MKIPLQLKCPRCGALQTQRVHLNNPSFDFTCEKCGKTSYGVSSLDNTVGVLILAKSWHELEIEKDYDMAIVLAATALDCELSFLYCKWKDFEALNANTDPKEKDYEEELRSMGKIVDKIAKVTKILDPRGIEQFVADSSWKDVICKGFPSLHLGSLANDFQETVFWPRNKILHQGDVSHTREDAAKSYTIAELGIRILKDMDKARRKAVDLV